MDGIYGLGSGLQLRLASRRGHNAHEGTDTRYQGGVRRHCLDIVGWIACTLGRTSNFKSRAYLCCKAKCALGA